MKKEKRGFDEAAGMLGGELSEVLLSVPESKKRLIHEIRLRRNKPVALSSGSEVLFVCENGEIVYSPQRAFVCTQRHIYDNFRRLCDYSLYSRQNEIKDGFITISGGHRIGLCGTAAVKNGSVYSVTDITSMNIRIARSIDTAAAELMPQICPLTGGVLICGAPSTGKTTLLRDISRRLSTGEGCRIMRVCVIDERGELSPGDNDNGLCDILRGYPKGEGIIQAVRSLSPQVIVCDEVGTEQDCIAAAQGANAGAYIIASIHAGSLRELMLRPQAKRLIETGAFSYIVMLSSSDHPCSISRVIPIGYDSRRKAYIYGAGGEQNAYA